MRRLTHLFIAALACIGLAGTAHAATTFDFQFDNSGGSEADGTISTPLVGTGTFISPVDLGVGQYALSSLPGFSVQFNIGSDAFGTADIATPIGQVAVDITQFGQQLRVVFTENGSPADGGPHGGSLDLVNGGGDAVSFEPSSAGGHNLYFATANADVPGLFGNYLGLSAAPEPSSFALLSAGLAGFGFLRRRRAWRRGG